MTQTDGNENGSNQFWSLGFELAEVGNAIAGVRMLIDMIDETRARDEYDEFMAPQAASAILTMIHTRLLDVGRVLRGEINPSQIWTPTNSTMPGTDDDPLVHDMIFPPWTPKQETIAAKRVLLRVKTDKERHRRSNDE
jgi:hypothetical protein